MFDKTGTLTHATPTVVDVVPFGGRNTDDVLRIAACLEELSPLDGQRRRAGRSQQGHQP